MRLFRAAALSALTLLPVAASAQSCGGNWSSFINGLRNEAVQSGIPQNVADQFFSGVRQSQTVLSRDRGQGFFQRPFIDFSRALISQNRLDRARQLLQRQPQLFQRLQREFGINPGVMLAFLAFETDFGQVQGDINTADALATLAHDCRRPELFRPQIIAMAELYRRGDLDPRTTQGAWAGEIGMVQMLPRDILALGVDADGNGHVDVRGSLPDAVLTGAALLRHHGWRPNEPWLVEVQIPSNLDLRQTGLRTQMSVSDWARLGVQARGTSLPSGGLRASVILPQGAGGPAFMIFDNFRVLFEWNQSFTYVVTAAYFATRIEGAPVYDAGNPSSGLDRDGMMALQRRLQARGFDVGEVDGILGAGTRAAVQDVQAQLGMPADGWPTPELLRRL
ncbi:lytic murein transglycosylase [Pararhodobacter sp. CCB-MM2]|uniref:lytic murein transglycosylase n=1 Tax=Pararhodobacter sp. CCB-MM2 TaxID=1786003 RepID=UPI00082D4BC4|nr:lytic murein transglycosylase [Pararhodobacter sp. CCB-MM2]MCA2011868.1 lytic murein transglycosylase [Cereibacter sphaeroides]